MGRCDRLKLFKNLKGLREKGESHTAACITGSAKGTVPQLFKRLMTAYGSPNFFAMPTMEDTYALTFKLMHGVDASPAFDIEKSDFVLSFGSGVLDGWGAPVRMFLANSGLKKSGGKLVQIEPRLSNTAAKSDQWVPVNPGTESILALGLAHVIIKESLYNKNFVEKYSFAFDGWTDSKGKNRKGFKDFVLEVFTPEKVAEKTGVKPEVIVSVAKSFAGAKRPLAICGRGKGMNPGSVHEFMAVHALNALVGNINNEGGVWAVADNEYVNWPHPASDPTAQKGIEKGRIDGAGEKESQSACNAQPFHQNGG